MFYYFVSIYSRHLNYNIVFIIDRVPINSTYIIT